MTDQTNSPAALPTAEESQQHANLISSVRAGLHQTIARISESNSATLEAQGKQAPAQNRTVSDRGGHIVKMNGDGTFEHETHGNVDEAVNPDLSAAASRRSETSLVNRMNAINKQVTDSYYYDSKTGEKKMHLTDDQYRRLDVEYSMLRRAHEAQTITTADLEVREAHAEQLKEKAIEKEQVIRAYANGDPAREKAIRAHLAELETKEVAATIYHTYRQ